MEESVKSLSLDYLNLLINGQAFSDVTFSVEGRLVPAHRCILAARSLFFRKFFCGGGGHHSPRSPTGQPLSAPAPTSPSAAGSVIPVSSVSYEVFLLLLQFIYSGQVSLLPQKHEPRTKCGDRGCWHTHCAAAVDLAIETLAAARCFGVEELAVLTQVLHQISLSLSLSLSLSPSLACFNPFLCDRGCWHTHCAAAVDLAIETLAAARCFGVEELAVLTQKHLASIVEKASIEDVMKVLMASRKQEINQLWTTCSHLVANSGLPPEVLAKHLPLDILTKIEELRLKSSLSRRTSSSCSSFPLHRGLEVLPAAAADPEDKIRRMRRALDSGDVDLVRLMVMGEGLNLDDALALHYAVENCGREVVKALLELGAADVNRRAGPAGKTPLHVAAEMVCPDMVAVLLDHHADPSARTADGVTPLDVLRALTSEFLFKGAVPGLNSHVEPNKLRLCLELVQSAALVMSREEAAAASNNGDSHHHLSIYPR